jgi:hypothetical protein
VCGIGAEQRMEERRSRPRKSHDHDGCNDANVEDLRVVARVSLHADVPAQQVAQTLSGSDGSGFVEVRLAFDGVDDHFERLDGVRIVPVCEARRLRRVANDRVGVERRGDLVGHVGSPPV